MSCDNTIIQTIFSSGMLSPNGVRATGIQFRIAASGCCSTSVSNVIDIVVPPCPPPPPPPPPPVGKCIPSVDLYGYTAIVAYDPINCGGGHVCNRALFDLYLNDIFIGQANLNNGDSTNGPAGGPRSGVFTINDHISSNNLKILLKCASPNDNCHQGIGRVILISPLNHIAYAECLPNDTDVFTGDTCCISGLYETGLVDNYNLYAFGSNNVGQLGMGPNSPNSYCAPTRVSGEGPWKKINNSMGIKHDDTLWLWGDYITWGIPWNLNGPSILTPGQETDPYFSYPQTPIPVQISGGGQWRDITSGHEMFFGIKNDDTLWAWGANEAVFGNEYGSITGFLGIENVGEAYIPVQIPGTWKKISSGRHHTLGIKNDNTLWVWGFNISGSLGIPNNPNNSIGTPIEISGGGQWKDAVGGYFCSFGIKNDDTLWAWGNNLFGKLGIGNIPQANTPVQISGTWKKISSNYTHTLGIKTDDTLWAWGDNFLGQLGIGNDISSNIPVQVTGKWKDVSVGNMHTLALKDDNTLWSWGMNNQCQLGLGYGFSSIDERRNITPEIKTTQGINYTYFTTPIKINNLEWNSIDADEQSSMGIQTVLRDKSWYISALPTGIDPPEFLPYNAYIYDPTIQDPTGFPATWNSFSNLLPDSKWIGPFESINSILQIPYSIIYSSNMYAPSSGSYTLNVIAYADNEINGFLNGGISYDDPNMPTITGGTPVIFDNNVDGLCSSSFILSSGYHTLSFVVKDYGGSVGLLVGTSGCFQAGPIATLSTPTGYVSINGNAVNLINAPNTDFPDNSFVQIAQQEGNTRFVNSPSLIIKPLKTPLTVELNDTNGGGCGEYQARIFRYDGNNYWGGSSNTALIASYVNSPITNLPTENYSISLTGMNESIRIFCTARDPAEGFCIGTSISFNLKFS